MWSFLLTGIVFGLSSGIAPGPLTTLVITETLRHDLKTGFKIACAPVLTDGPLIIVSALLLNQVQDINWLLGCISLVGSLFLAYLAWECLTIKPIHEVKTDGKPRAILKGMLTNLLNPSPYLFWFSVGTPTLLKGFQDSILSGAAFLFGMFAFIISGKVVIALLVERFRGFLESRAYLAVNRLMGLVLAVFGFLFLRDGINYLSKAF